MNKKWLRRILAMAMVFSLAAGSWVTGYADDGEGISSSVVTVYMK